MVSKTPSALSSLPQSKRKSNSTDQSKEALKNFRLIFKSVKKHFQWVEQQTGVNGAQLWALSAIGEKPGMTVSDLSKSLAVHQSTASNLVEKLVKKGFVRRERNSDDQRIVHLYAQPDGLALVKDAPKPLQGVLPDALSEMPVAELEQLNALLAQVIGKMKVRDASGKSTPLADI